MQRHDRDCRCRHCAPMDWAPDVAGIPPMRWPAAIAGGQPTTHPKGCRCAWCMPDDDLDAQIKRVPTDGADS